MPIIENIHTNDTYEIADSKARNDITTLETRINIIEKRKIIMIGDSYGEQNDGSVSTFFWEYFRQSLGLTENDNFFKSFENGAGFGNGRFLAQLQAIYTTLEKPYEITDIYVLGGWNDSDKSQTYGTDEAFNNGVTQFDNYVKSNFNNAKITLSHISWGDPQKYPQTLIQMPVSIERYSQQSVKGWRITTNTEWILHDYRDGVWQSDGAHPSQYGQGLLGLHLTTAFLTGSTSITRSNIKNKTVVTNGIGNLNKNPISSEILQNNSVYLEVVAENVYIDLNNQIFDCTGDTAYDLLGSDYIFFKGNGNNCFIDKPILIYDGSKFKMAEARIYLFNNLFRFRLRVLKDDGTGTNESQQIKYLFIDSFSINIPAISC